MEFHAWVKQRPLKCWPNSADASAHMKEKSIVKSFWEGRRLWAEVKGTTLGLRLTFVQTEPACSVVWYWTGKRADKLSGNGGKRGPSLFYTFSWIFALLVWAHVHVYAHTCAVCVYSMHFKKLQSMACNEGSWHSAVPFARCHFIFLSVCCAP